MNEQANGMHKAKSVDDFELADLRSWALAYTSQDGGLLGPIHETVGDSEVMPDIVILSPAYVFRGGHHLIVANGPGGQPTPMFLAGAFSVGPFEFLNAPLRIPVRPVIFIPLSALNDADFADLGGKVLAGVRSAEQARLQIRAQKAGVAIAGANPQLPPLGGAGFGGGRRG